MLTRALLLIGFPVCVVWAFAETLAREGGRACWFAWNAVRQEAEAFSASWRAAVDREEPKL